MADLNDILNGVTKEIRLKVSRLTPDEKGGTKRVWRYHKPSAGKFEEQTDRTRLFSIVWDSCVPVTVGGTAVTWDCVGGIKIGYPANGWDITMLSDYQLIFDALNLADSSVTGCAYRHVPALAEIDIEDLEDDWKVLNVPIEATIQTS